MFSYKLGWNDVTHMMKYGKKRQGLIARSEFHSIREHDERRITNNEMIKKDARIIIRIRHGMRHHRAQIYGDSMKSSSISHASDMQTNQLMSPSDLNKLCAGVEKNTRNLPFLFREKKIPSTRLSFLAMCWWRDIALFGLVVLLELVRFGAGALKYCNIRTYQKTLSDKPYKHSFSMDLRTEISTNSSPNQEIQTKF